MYLPHNIDKHLYLDWHKHQVDKINTSAYKFLILTAVTGRLHYGFKRKHGTPKVAKIIDINFYNTTARRIR